MPKYGIIEDEILITSDNQLAGYKPVEYKEIPEFDQMTQAVYQGKVKDEGDFISVGVEIRDLEQDENDNYEEHI